VYMKRRAYIFADDGSPEASDSDTCYIGYDPEDPLSYAEAVSEAKRRISVQTGPVEGSGNDSTLPRARSRRHTGWLCRMLTLMRESIARTERQARCAAMDCALPLRKCL
jgi:hypothetical protein